ncbi:MAG: hypothetical protein ACWA41_07650 [Putridiphycobacter sp.]
MKKFIWIAAAIILSSSIISCGTKRTREEKVSAIINKIDAPFLITTLTPQNIIDKSGVNEDGVLPYTYQTLTSFFLDDDGTGVDNNTQVQTVLGKGPMTPNIYSIFRVKDGELFKTMVKAELNAVIKEKENVNYFIKEKDAYVVAWQDDIAIAANIPFDIKSLFSSNGSSGSKTVNHLIKLLNAADEGEVNQTYMDVMAKSDDVNMYFMLDSLSEYVNDLSPKKSKTKEPTPFDAFQSTTMEAALNFEKGRVNFAMDYHFTPETEKQLDFIKSSGIGASFLNFGKSTQPVMTYGFNIDLKKYVEFADKMSDGEFSENMSRDLKDLEEEYGISYEDVIEIFSGSGLVMVDGVTSETFVEESDFNGEPYTYNTTKPIIGLVMEITEPTALQAVFADKGEMKENYFKIEEFYITLTGNEVFMSNDEDWTKMIAANEGKKIKNYENVLTENAISYYADFGGKNVEKAAKVEGLEFAAIFEMAYGFSTTTHGEFNLILKDDSHNSLRVITKFYSDLMAEFEEQQNEEMKKILDQEILDNLEENMDSIVDEFETVMEDIGEQVENETDKALNDALDGLNNALDKVK